MSKILFYWNVFCNFAKIFYKSMEITGKIIFALPERGGVSKSTGTEWKSQEFVIETHDQYPRKCVFTVFGSDRLNAMNIQVGEELTVSFDIDAHEWQGRWFNDIRAWKVDRVSDVAAQANAAAPVTAAASTQTAAPANDAPFPAATDIPAESSVDDLPF